jgi:uncharacterized phage protein gp47/JayE
MSTTPVAGCCGSTAAPLTAPLPISNASGLPAIQYRIGTFSSFRQAMLDDVPLPDLLATSITTVRANIAADANILEVVDASQFPLSAPFRVKVGGEYIDVVDGAGTTEWTITRGASAVAHEIGEAVVLAPANPFANWHEGITGDYQTMFVELWAYLGDILTFYQERIANEAYLQTATQRNSLLQLAGLVDYQPSPGSGADGLIAFLAAKNQSIVVPAGFRVGSKPAPGKPTVVFETAAAITALGNNSSMPLSAVSPDVQFATNTIVLQGTSTSLAVNDYVLVVEGTTPLLLQLSAVNADKVSNTTTINWPVVNGGYNQASKEVVLYAFRTTASPFGSTAPVWSTLPPVLTNSLTDGTQHVGASWDTDWDSPTESLWREIFNILEAPAPEGLARDAVAESLPERPIIGRNPTNGLLFIVNPAVDVFLWQITNPWFYIPMPGDPQNVLFLDTVYSDLKYSAQNPGWAVVMTGGTYQILQVSQSRQVAKTGYTLTAKVTRLDCTTPVTQNLYPLRDTTILTGSEPLAIQQDLPLPAVVSGGSIVLAGVQGQLQDGQTVVFSGVIAGTVNAQSTGTVASETCVLDGPPVTDAANGVTVIELVRPLANQYVRSTCSVMANIVEVTQGETVKDEVLGNGNGSASQAYVLKQSPLTYLPSTDPDSLSPVESTLTVMVNGVEWVEQPNFAASAPHDQHYTVTINDAGSTIVTFGDGVHGACPPSGVQNIHASYRKGLGNSGNVAGGVVKQLVDSLPGLQGVMNPVGFNGGSDAETIDDIRIQAPTSLKTFSRAVSIADYAALALSYPGIAKANASLVQLDPSTGKPVVHPFIQLTVATSNQAPIMGTPLAGKLRQFLDSRRDMNVMLRILDSTPVYIAVSVTVDIDSRYPHQGTINAVQAALNPGINPDGTAGYFAFQSLKFGQAIYLSDLYAAIQAVPGVLDANVTQLAQVNTTKLFANAVPRLSLLENIVPVHAINTHPAVNPIHPVFPIHPVLPIHLPILTRIPAQIIAVPVPAAQDIVVGPTQIITIDANAAPGSGLFVTGQGGYADS